MADGSTKAIEKVALGDEVLAKDPTTGEQPQPHRVIETLRSRTERLIHVAIDTDGDGRPDGEIQTTGQHPFWTLNRGWVAAKHLASSDLLIDSVDAPVLVVSVKSVPAARATYNLSVDGVHTFYALAGETPILVHNATVPPYNNPSVPTTTTFVGQERG